MTTEEVARLWEYWAIGKELEEQVKPQPRYGKQAVAGHAAKKGISPQLAYECQRFHECFPAKKGVEKLIGMELAWSKIRILTRRSLEKKERQQLAARVVSGHGMTARELQRIVKEKYGRPQPQVTFRSIERKAGRLLEDYRDAKREVRQLNEESRTDVAKAKRKADSAIRRLLRAVDFGPQKRN